MKSLVTLAVACAFASASHAALTVYSNDASFKDAAGKAGTVKFESFETLNSVSDTEIEFSGGLFSCSPGNNCPGFLGVSDQESDDGIHSIFFASPSNATFTFNTPIYAFGIAIGNAGDDFLDEFANPVSPNPLDLSALLDTGDKFTLYGIRITQSTTFDANDRIYLGLISDKPFTSVTFQPSNADDGIFFDSLSYVPAAAAIPEPHSLALLGLGLAGLRIRRKPKLS